MRAEEIQVGKLFDSGQQILVPLWQRHYSWEHTQLQELWDDLMRVYSRRATEHFMGSVVLHKLTWSGLPSEAHRYWVVDGQQRIATLTILICAVRDRLVSLEPSDIVRPSIFEDYSSQLLINTNLKEEYGPRLVPQEKDRASLDPIIAGAWSGQADSRIEKAYKFYRDRVSGLDSQETVTLLSNVLTKLSAVWVTLDDSDNAHRVFQTLNAGGKALRQADLVRNYFFLLLGGQGDAFYEKRWRGMEASLGERGLEQFFVAWAVSQGHTGSTGSLFSYFQKDLRDRESDVDSVLEYGEALVQASRLFHFVRKPEDGPYSTEIARTMVDLRNWGTLPAEGLLLWLLRKHAENSMSDANLHQALEIVMSFMARRQLAGYEPNLHKSILVAAARKLRASQLTDEDLVDYLMFILSVGDEVRKWPSNEEIREEVKTTPVYSRARRSWSFSILERIDRSIYNNPKSAPNHLARDKYSVEHILPQSLSQVWIDDLANWGELSPYDLHETRLHVLGNLTLTPINSEMGNRRYRLKRAQLTDDVLRINKYFEKCGIWGRAEIDARSLALAEVASQAYVSPLAVEQVSVARSRFEREEEETQDLQVSDELLDEEAMDGELE